MAAKSGRQYLCRKRPEQESALHLWSEENSHLMGNYIFMLRQGTWAILLSAFAGAMSVGEEELCRE
jgi:hypothetical protein